MSSKPSHVFDPSTRRMIIPCAQCGADLGNRDAHECVKRKRRKPPAAQKKALTRIGKVRKRKSAAKKP